MRIKWLLASVLLISISCNRNSAQKVEQSSNYYFPVKDFFTERTDCFVNKNDTTDKSYWTMKTYLSGRDTIFQTSIYDSEKRILDFTTEKVINGNAKINSYILYDYDSEGTKIASECVVLDSVLFKPSQVIGESIKWRIKFRDFRYRTDCELSKVRTLVSEEGNKKVFTDEMSFNVVGSSSGYKYKATMVYQKGMGLVSYKMTLPNGIEKDYIIQSRN